MTLSIPLIHKNSHRYALSKKMIKRYQHKIIFKQHKTGRINSLVLPNATYSPWEQNEDFLKIFKIARQSTLVDKYRLYDLFILSQQLATVAGDFLEIGVWRGGSGALLASTAKSLDGHRNMEGIGQIAAVTAIACPPALPPTFQACTTSTPWVTPRTSGATPGDTALDAAVTTWS